MRAYRLYKPATDATKPTSYKFINDGTALWVAQTPMAGYCNDATASCRNIFTALPNGTVVSFTDANAATLSPYLNTWDAAGLIDYVRTQPLGAVISSTPAFMDPPSLDPPPDSDYPGFAADHEDRRTLIFIGANDGMMHAIDARTGVEVWAFIPFNLLPKLRTLRDGQGVDSYAYFVDTSAKVADVKIGGVWRTMVTFGEGVGGTFYQAFDASLDDMASSISPDSDSVSSLLSYFNNTDRIKYLWAFPRYSVFDTTINTTAAPYGDLSSSASADEKSVGQTWSDPAVGQIKDTTGPSTIIVGSGFLPRSVENGSTRGGATAGQKLYLLSAEDGHVFASSSVGNDGAAETDDDCAAMTYGCTKFKNALQADPVATGPSDSRSVTKATSATSTEGLEVQHRSRFVEEPRVQRIAARVVYAGHDGPADLLLDGRGLGRHAGVSVRWHRQRPAAVVRCRERRAVPAARHPGSRIDRREEVPDRPRQG
jgi:hypothetical protein